MTFTLDDLDKRVQERFVSECKNEASQARRYLAGKQGCDADDVVLPEEFSKNLFMIENGAKGLFGPYWAKRVDEEFIVLRDGRRFSVDDFSEIAWDEVSKYAHEYEDDANFDDDLADYNRSVGRLRRAQLKSENVTSSPLFPNCRVIPYTRELEQIMLWREDCNAAELERAFLGKYFHRYKLIKDVAMKVVKYVHAGSVWVAVALLILFGFNEIFNVW